MVLNDSDTQTRESDWRHDLDEFLDFIDEIVNITTKIVVELDGRDILKDYLLVQLNGNPALFKDRLN